MNDTETDVSVLVDRAVGGASIADGQLEIMLHRYPIFKVEMRDTGFWANAHVCSMK